MHTYVKCTPLEIDNWFHLLQSFCMQISLFQVSSFYATGNIVSGASSSTGNIVLGASSFWPVCLLLCLSVTLSVCVKKNFNLGHNFWTVIGTAFIFHMCIPCDKTFPLVPKFVTLTMTFDLYFENFDHNYWTITDMAFIFHMCIPCDNTFPSVPKYLISWPWPWPLTYILKSLTLLITFEP